MAERYKRVFSLPGGLYASGAPVLIRAGALLYDTLSRNLLCQIKFYNLDESAVRSLTLSLQLKDSAGQEIGKEVRREYRDLQAERDAEFGQNTALLLPYRNARGFSARVIRVVFDDGTVWEDEGEPWLPTIRQKTLREAYGDEEVAAQFRVRYGIDCQFAPCEDGELWYCTCGTVNDREENSCHTCKRVRKALLSVNEDALRRECRQRLENESLREEADPDREEAGPSFWRVLAVIVPLMLLVALIIYSAPRVLNRLVPLPVIPTAAEMPAATETPVATVAPTPVSTPTPEPTLSPADLQRAAYDEAAALLDTGSYSAARAAFLSMEGYGDSEQMAREAVYRKALALYGFLEQYDERGIYAYLSMDPAETSRFSLSSANALALGSPAITALRLACGGDAVDITMEDTPSEGLKPFGACVRDLFSYLGDYRDSAERLASLDVLTDYTRDFYMLLEAGDIYSAYDWLESFPGEFAGREHWLQLLNLYKPFCDDWVLYAGDPTLVPLTAGHDFSCMRLNSRVLISGDLATLRFRIPYGESEIILDLYAETGNLNFSTGTDFFYLAVVSNVDHLAYMKYYDGTLMSSVEYERAY